MKKKKVLYNIYRYIINTQLYNNVFCRTEFLITASCDGHIKFWKRNDEGVEFVKHFKAHMGEMIANFYENCVLLHFKLLQL